MTGWLNGVLLNAAGFAVYELYMSIGNLAKARNAGTINQT